MLLDEPSGAQIPLILLASIPRTYQPQANCFSLMIPTLNIARWLIVLLSVKKSFCLLIWLDFNAIRIKARRKKGINIGGSLPRPDIAPIKLLFLSRGPENKKNQNRPGRRKKKNT